MPFFAFFVIFSVLLSSLRAVLDSGESDPNTTFYPLNSIIYDDSIIKNECNESVNLCIRKCCDLNYILKDETCVLSESMNLQVILYENNNTRSDLVDIHFITGMEKCSDGSEMVEYNISNNQTFLLYNSDGELWQTVVDEYFDYDPYCLEYLEGVGVSAFACPIEPYFDFGYRLKVVGIIISLPFLLATFIVYALLPERNLHGTSLMCYVMTFFTTSFLIVLFAFVPIDVQHICGVLTIIGPFLFMVSMCWMNVMSYDIWSTISNSGGFLPYRKRKKRRFLLYNIYAWGVPLLRVALMEIIRATAPSTAWYHPGTSKDCMLRDGIPIMLYIIVPMAILITANIILFGATAWKIKQAQNDLAAFRKNQSYENGKQRFHLYIKLMLAMGVNWSVELIKWLFELYGNVPEAVWYLSDFCNAAFGVFLFFIFVFKKNIWILLKKRYYMVIGKPYRARTIAMKTPTTFALSLRSLRMQSSKEIES